MIKNSQLALWGVLLLAIGFWLMMSNRVGKPDFLSPSDSGETMLPDSSVPGELDSLRRDPVVQNPEGDTAPPDSQVTFYVVLGNLPDSPPCAGATVLIRAQGESGPTFEGMTDESGQLSYRSGHAHSVVATASAYGQASSVSVEPSQWQSEEPVIIPLNITAVIQLKLTSQLAIEGLSAATRFAPFGNGATPGIVWHQPMQKTVETEFYWDLVVPVGVSIHVGVRSEDQLLLIQKEVSPLLPHEVRQVAIILDVDRYCLLTLSLDERIPLPIPKVPDLAYHFQFVLSNARGFPILAREFQERPPFSFRLLTPRSTGLVLEILTDAYAPQVLPIVSTELEALTVNITLQPSGILKLVTGEDTIRELASGGVPMQLIKSGSRAPINTRISSPEVLEIRGIGFLTTGIRLGRHYFPIAIQDGEILSQDMTSNSLQQAKGFTLDFTLRDRTHGPLRVTFINAAGEIAAITNVASATTLGERRFIARSELVPGAYQVIIDAISEERLSQRGRIEVNNDDIRSTIVLVFEETR